jgi:integral membrane sensor domain MASE1
MNGRDLGTFLIVCFLVGVVALAVVLGSDLAHQQTNP